MGSRTPHDALFHFTFSRKENAIGELRAVLPPQLVARIDWTTLELSDGHYIDEELSKRQSDFLYSVKVGGVSIALYLLFEHQSTSEALMAFRVLRYLVRIWDRWLADHPGATKLPVIVPVVLSHAEGGWRAATSMVELYELPSDVMGEVLGYLPAFRFVLDDLTQHTDEELRARAVAAMGTLTLGLLRWSRSGAELLAHMAEYGEALEAMWRAPEREEAVRVMFRYMALAREPVTIQNLESLFGALGAEAHEVAMTEGQRMIDQWRAEGEARGEASGRAKALMGMFAARGLRVSDELRERILRCRDVPTLDRWIVRGTTAASAAEALSEA